MDQSGQLRRVFTQLEEPHLLHTLESLDTVRALHQTVVALRKALESSQLEIQKLKKQITVQHDIDDGKTFKHEQDPIQSKEPSLKLQPPLPPPSSKSQLNSNIHQPQQQRQVTFCGTDKIFSDESRRLDSNNRNNGKKLKSDFETPGKYTSTSSSETILKTQKSTTSQSKILSSSSTLSSSAKNHRTKKFTKTASNKNEADNLNKSSSKPHISVTSYPTLTSSQDNLNRTMSSKIGVKIRVSSNIELGSSSSELDSARSTTATEAAGSGGGLPAKNDEKNKSEISKADETEPVKNLKINVIPDEDENEMGKGAQLIDTKDQQQKLEEPSTSQQLDLSSSNLHLDVDNISIYSMSEGDNSVFTEGPTTPVDQSDINALKHDDNGGAAHDDDDDYDNKLRRESTQSEHPDDVDDIELIFSSDDNKEILQEDLVSISDYEPWQVAGSSGTPVLVKYSPLPSDHSLVQSENGRKAISESGGGRKNNLKQSHRSEDGGISRESGESRLNKSLDFTNKSSSLEKDYSEDERDGVQRDESFDQFDPGDSSTLGQRWKNFNVLVETDISKCGILEESTIDMSRRNTCPNPPAYRPIINGRQQPTRCPLAVKFSRSPRTQYQRNPNRPVLNESNRGGPKRSSSAQTEISALPDYWRSESHLAGGCYDGVYTLPSKFVPPLLPSFRKYPLRPSDKSQEARRILLSDINFTSMVPELSRSADHLCHEEAEEEDEQENNEHKQSERYYKGNLLKTPESFSGVTPSVSMTSPGVSQWTVNDNSYTQTTQTEYWGNRGDSFDSCKSYSLGSKYSGSLSRHNRSRSVPSVRCAICKQTHFNSGMRTSESMHYTPRVTFQEPTKASIRGSLPDLRHDCTCPRRYGGPSLYKIHGDSEEESTDSLLDEAEDYLKRSVDDGIGSGTFDYHATRSSSTNVQSKRVNNRRCSENDIQRDYIPSKQTLPFLPKSSKCLKPGHLAKVISKNGRVVIGRVRYIGPLASGGDSGTNGEDAVYIGLQLPNKFGDCDGTIDGRRFFECEPLQGIFVPFKKIVMAWTS